MANLTNRSSNRSFYMKFGTLINFGTTFTLKKSTLKKWPNCAKFAHKVAKLANFTNKNFNEPIHTKFDTLVNFDTKLPLKKSNLKNWPNCPKFV